MSSDQPDNKPALTGKKKTIIIITALTSAGHAGRSFIGSVLFAVLSALGVFKISGYLKSSALKKVFFMVMAVIIGISAWAFAENYFFRYPKYSASA